MALQIAPIDELATDPTAFLVADSDIELKKAARKLGLVIHNTHLRHVDVPAHLYEQAIGLGVIRITSAELLKIGTRRLDEIRKRMNS